MIKWLAFVFSLFASAAFAQTLPTKSGPSNTFLTTTGTLTVGDCLKVGASKDAIDSGGVCGGGGGGTPGGSNTQLQFNNSGSFGGLPLTWVAPQLQLGDGITSANAHLFLYLFNPPGNNDPNDRNGFTFFCTHDGTTNNTGFSGDSCEELTGSFEQGLNVFPSGAYPNATQAKITQALLGETFTAQAAGQRIASTLTMNCWGMGDCFRQTETMRFATGNIPGDEGVGRSTQEHAVNQTNRIATTTITAISRTTCSTTINTAVTFTNGSANIAIANANTLLTVGQQVALATTGGLPTNFSVGTFYFVKAVTSSNFTLAATLGGTPIIAGSAGSGTQSYVFYGAFTPQTITVGSTTGCNTGDYVIIQQIPGAGGCCDNEEPVHITAVSVGNSTISGIFRLNFHFNGTTILPALNLTVDFPFEFGQNRVIVDLSGSSSTGNLASTSGGTLVGSGTSWNNSIVGGDANQIGCIALTADTYANGGSPLLSWYQISVVTDTTHLAIRSWSTAGDSSYRGNWSLGTPGYTMRPCARVLDTVNHYWGGNAGLIMEDWNPADSTNWQVGHVIEAAISPYPDVSGDNLNVAVYTPGCTCRQLMGYENQGNVQFQVGFVVGGGALYSGSVPAFATGMIINNYVVGLDLSSAGTGATMGLALKGSGTLNQSKISWIGSTAYMGVNSGYVNIGSGNGSTGILQFGDDVTAGDINFNGSVILEDKGGKNNRLRFFTGTPSSPVTYVELQELSQTSIVVNEFNTGGPNPAISLFSMGQATSGANAYKFGAAVLANTATANTSNTTNQPSYELGWNTAVWDGAASQNRGFISDVTVASGVNNASMTLNFRAMAAACGSIITAFPDTLLSLTDTGKITFGLSNPGNCGIADTVTLNPSNTTAARTWNIADVTGVPVIGVATGTTVGAAGAASDLPAHPLGWIQIPINAAGTLASVPYYNHP